MIGAGNKIGIVGCSNGQKRSYAEKIKCLENTLLSMGLTPVFSNCIYEKEDAFSGTAKERAQALMKFYEDDEIKGIFDISGGDLANGVLPYLDYDRIAKSQKLFWGYSDLTTVINAIYAKTGKPSVLYQIRNLLYEHKEAQIANFRNVVIDGGDDLFQIKYRFIQQSKMQGIVVGGNIRCFLKLAGILLGTFTQMEEEQCSPTVETLVRDIAGNELPIAVTKDIGHGTDSKAIIIGREFGGKIDGK